VRYPLKQSILVLPKRYPLPQILLPGSRKYQRGGISLASSVGNSQEFVSTREYRPGDPVRQIHWKSWAKLGKPVIKEFQDEFFERHGLILDTFIEKSNYPLFEEAVSVAASFASQVQTQESIMDLMFIGSKAYCFSAGRGLAQTEKVLEILASVQQCTEKAFSSLTELVIGHVEALTGCICIFVQWNKERKKND